MQGEEKHTEPALTLSARIAQLREKMALIEGLLNETWVAHRDKDSPDYNECEAAECVWCEETHRLVKEMASLLTPTGREP